MATRMKKSLRNPSRKLRTSADPLADCAAEFKDLRQLCGKNVRAWRERRGLTLDQLSERCGVSSNTIYRVERGWGDRSIVIHAKIAEGLGVKISKLWKGDDEIFKRIWKKTKKPAAPRPTPRAFRSQRN